VKTPGGKLAVHYTKKIAKGPSCGDCGCQISGIPHLRHKAYRRLSKPKKTVSRAYGGNRCGTCVRERIIRAFLVEEQKAVKQIVKASAKKQLLKAKVKAETTTKKQK